MLKCQCIAQKQKNTRCKCKAKYKNDEKKRTERGKEDHYSRKFPLQTKQRRILLENSPTLYPMGD